MTDSMVTQREARRQKLLKNAENRMNRLRPRPQSEADEAADADDDLPSPDLELREIDSKERLDSGNVPIENVNNDESRTASPYNLRRRPRQGSPISNDNDGVRDRSPSQAKPSSVPYEIVDDPEVPSLAEFLAKQEATKTTTPNNRQQAFNPNVSYLPPKTIQNNVKERETRAEYIRVIGLVFTALVSRLILSYDFGSDFFLIGYLFRSMFFPLVLFEVFISYALQWYMPGVSSAPPQGSLLTTALMLCGIKAELVQVYIRIMSRVSALSNDLFLYLFAFLMWHLLLGS